MNNPNSCCATPAMTGKPANHDEHRRNVREAYAQVAKANNEGQR